MCVVQSGVVVATATAAEPSQPATTFPVQCRLATAAAATARRKPSLSANSGPSLSPAPQPPGLQPTQPGACLTAPTVPSCREVTVAALRRLRCAGSFPAHADP